MCVCAHSSKRPAYRLSASRTGSVQGHATRGRPFLALGCCWRVKARLTTMERGGALAFIRPSYM